MVFHQLNHQLGVIQQMVNDLEHGFYTRHVHHLADATIGAHQTYH
jgi:hypothetical protein